MRASQSTLFFREPAALLKRAGIRFPRTSGNSDRHFPAVAKRYGRLFEQFEVRTAYARAKLALQRFAVVRFFSDFVSARAI